MTETLAAKVLMLLVILLLTKLPLLSTDPNGATRYAVAKGNDAAGALVAAKAKAVDIFKILVFTTLVMMLLKLLLLRQVGPLLKRVL